MPNAMVFQCSVQGRERLPGGSGHPLVDDFVWTQKISKEVHHLCDSAKAAQDLGAPDVEEGHGYRMPNRGERVMVAGMRRRPNLNGAEAEIVSSRPDESGFVMVQIMGSAEEENRTMRVRPDRLRPLGASSSSPSLHDSSSGLGRSGGLSAAALASLNQGSNSFANRSESATHSLASRAPSAHTVSSQASFWVRQKFFSGLGKPRGMTPIQARSPITNLPSFDDALKQRSRAEVSMVGGVPFSGVASSE